jgi:nitrate/nitrite transport system ATP-binding protein
MDPNRYLSIESVGKVFPAKKGDFAALTGIDLAVRKGEFVTLIGHSGCGKSTLLNLVAGLSKPTEGTILLAGRHVDGPGPDRGVVFQNHSLLPWLTCFENVHLAVERVFGESRSRLRRRTHEALELVGLAQAEHQYPHEISGGMKQRVGIARALAMEPKVLLLDEPFGALDALTRATLQDELMRIVENSSATVLMVTHDVDEAVLLSDRVVMMTNGPAARIGEVLAVTLPRPRERLALAHDARFMDLRARVLEFLYQKQAYPAKSSGAALKVA